ncbi:hypothetical protein PHLCEN_2v12258, partial [Hermanssonia centrifuga]
EFVQVVEFLQHMLLTFSCLRVVPWFLLIVLKLPDIRFAASALKLGGVELIGNCEGRSLLDDNRD